jgi:hypothetical protein
MECGVPRLHRGGASFDQAQGARLIPFVVVEPYKFRATVVGSFRSLRGFFWLADRKDCG